LADFTAQDKFNKNQNFARIEFGAEAPLLEVELNEAQKIQNYKRNLAIAQLLKDGFITKGAMSFSGGTLTVPIDTIVAGGEVIQILEAMSLTGLVATNVVYLHVFETEVTKDTALKNSGNLSGGSALTNQIQDSRVGAETSRRLQKQVQLVTSSGTAEGEYWLPVATITGSTTFTDNRVKTGLLAKNIPIEDVGGHFTGTEVETALSELFTSVSNGKTNIATAITDNGGIASGSNTFSQLATAISNLTTPHSSQSYTTPGTYTWTVPANVTQVTVLVGGAGGGGGSGNNTAYCGGGGGGGGTYIGVIDVTPGDTIPIVVGTGGSGGAAGARANGTAGGNSSFNTTCIGYGGGAGLGGASGVGGAGGAGGAGGGYGGGGGLGDTGLAGGTTPGGTASAIGGAGGAGKSGNSNPGIAGSAGKVIIYW
jgi:hypothetical protein